ncbi:MAG: tetratricopeptide repeat protein [Pyrinomonadaceae bacterium]
MKLTIFAVSLVLGLSSPGFSQHSDHTVIKKAEVKPATIVPGMGSHRHLVSTGNPLAQKFFDQALSFVYAFNHDEAVRSFKRAAELDPQLAMAQWGIALALGPNINLDVDPAREQAAYEAVQKALLLAAGAPENERAYIEALSRRYSIDPQADLKKLAVEYKNAMGEVVKRYPDDLDAATLYAESAMNLRPWQLWTLDGKPVEGTEEIIAVLESVLRRDPNHIGAIHYYIHAVEASPTPERALAYAAKLRESVPAAGHLVHMPAHIYGRTGDYQLAARSNKEAAAADEAYFKAHGVGGVYPLIYYAHNLHFEAYSHAMSGRYADAMSVAGKLETFVRPYIKEMPMAEGFIPTPTIVRLRFHKWNEILASPKPDPGLPLVNAFWHFARGVAFAATGRKGKAGREQAAFSAAVRAVPEQATIGLNRARKVLAIAENVLHARISAATNRDGNAVIDYLRAAVEMEDSLAYDEPPGWFLPVRESLGATLFRTGDYAGAERVFRADLERNKRNGRSLFGLQRVLRAQRKTYAATLVQREFDKAWRYADTSLRLEDF